MPALLYRSVFSKISVVLTTKLSDNYVWDKEDDIAIKAGRLSGIIKELKALSDQSIEEIRSSEIEAIVAECTNIPIGKIQAREKDRLLSIESKLQERVKGQNRAITTLSDAIKVRIAEIINSQTSLEELYQLRGLFISGCNYVTTDSKTPITDDIVDYFLQKMKSKINELPDQMQKALRNLTEGTVEQLIIIDRLPYPDKSCTYELRAIFAYEDANALFDAICKLSNKSRNTFTQFLAYHYNFDYDLQDVGDRYKADVPCLLKLKDLVGNEISISKGVDKLAFIRLKDALIEAIRRCEGKSDTLPPM